MRRSYNADAIVNEYRRKQYYSKKAREKCKEKECIVCSWNKVCTDVEEVEEECIDKQ